MPTGMASPCVLAQLDLPRPGRALGRGINHLSSMRVVIARYLPEAGRALLAERFGVDEGGAEMDRQGLLERARGADAIVADPTVQVDEELLDAAGGQLRVVANFGVGVDNIDLAACRAHGVVVTNTPDVLTNATAELAVALMLAAARRLGEGERLVRAGRWTGWEPGQLLGRELAGCVVGIVGLGRIGSRVGELLSGFGVTLLYSARSPKREAANRLGAQYVRLDELFARADFVTLHAPLTPETHHLVDQAALARFKPGAILVNTSRGGLVDSTALAAALRTGRLAGAGLDVYEREPEVPKELLELENVVLAPHLGSATAQARDGMATLVAENVIAVLEGDAPVTPV